MLFLGTFMGYDEFTIPCTPTATHLDITEVTLKNGKYEKLYVTKTINDDFFSDFPNDWDNNTIMYARFDRNSSNAGNVDWTLSNISHILIKRKEIDSFHWITIKVKEIIDKQDFNITDIDFTNAAKTTYEYAIVPSFYGIEGNYDVARILSDFDQTYIIGQNGIIHTMFGNGYLDTVNNTPLNYLVTTHSKYPTVIRNSQANYITGSFSGNFIKFDGEKRDYITDDKTITDLQKSVTTLLSDGTPKLIKHFDGRIILANIDSEISNNAEGYYKNRVISFNFTEIGDASSEEDLYYSGLSNVTEEWW